VIDVIGIPCLNDNYAWMLRSGRDAAVVDPSEARPVLDALAAQGATLTAIWNTHHHHDHVGGNLELARRFPGVPIFASAVDRERVPGVTHTLRAGDRVAFAGQEATILEIPAHTHGHIAYVLGRHLFCGDTLFGGGCGRLFEGTPADMRAALAQLRALPDDTLVHCGHEYTWHNLRWAVETGIEPGNAALRERHARVARDPSQRTVPTSLAEEKAANPFLRWDAPEIAGQFPGTPDETFAALRRAKDVWRA
jgi:hydroxyacylglutathione hydrolase